MSPSNSANWNDLAADLSAAVAVLLGFEGVEKDPEDASAISRAKGDDLAWDVHRYATDWNQGGPLIEKYKINLYPADPPRKDWCAMMSWEFKDERSMSRRRSACEYGPTPLFAAMRCLVVSKLWTSEEGLR